MNSIKTALILELNQNANNEQRRARYIKDKIKYCNERINSLLEQLNDLKNESYCMSQEELEQNMHECNKIRTEIRTTTNIIKELINLI